MHLGPQEDVLLDRTQRLLLLWEIVQDSCPEVLEVLGTSHAAHEIFPLDFEPQHTPVTQSNLDVASNPLVYFIQELTNQDNFLYMIVQLAIHQN